MHGPEARAVPLFPICTKSLPWLPQNVAGGTEIVFLALSPLGFQKHLEQVCGSQSLPLVLYGVGKGLGDHINTTSPQGSTAKCVVQGHIWTQISLINLILRFKSCYTSL